MGDMEEMMRLQLGSQEAQALERALNDWKRLFTGTPVGGEAIKYRDTVYKVYDRLLSEINDG